MTLNALRTHGGPAEDKTTLSYLLVVEWSEEDQIFIGSCPGNYRTLLSRIRP